MVGHHCVSRSGIDKNIGTHWLRVEQPKEGKIVFKQVEVEGDTIVTTDKDNNVFYKLRFSNDVKGKFARPSEILISNIYHFHSN